MCLIRANTHTYVHQQQVESMKKYPKKQHYTQPYNAVKLYQWLTSPHIAEKGSSSVLSNRLKNIIKSLITKLYINITMLFNAQQLERHILKKIIKNILKLNYKISSS